LPFKRPLDVVRAAARLQRQALPVRVVVAGSGELAPAMLATAKTEGVKLDLLGFQNQSRMPAAYAAADVLMLPSDGRETWGLVCNEALACGRPIVVSDAAGCAEDLAGDGQAGAVFAVGDIGQAAMALQRVLAKPPTAEAIAGRSRAYSLAAAARGVEAAMKDLAR
jgi:glycosyltransferase involved in cell wall biosynthesis